jgi:hypothetical protein
MNTPTPVSANDSDRHMQEVLRFFDADAFLTTEYLDAFDTTRTLMPQGEILIKTIVDLEIIKPRLWTNPETREQRWMEPSLKLKMLIEDEGIRTVVNAREGRDLFFTYLLNLQLNHVGMLDNGPNRNLELGQLREAVGQNTPGVHWAFANLKNCIPFYVHNKHIQKDDKVYEKITSFYPVPEQSAAA